ncbi:DNA-binding transcriptional regulator HcaR, partial [Escherichia coli]
TIGFVPSAEVNLLPKVLPMFRLRQPDTLIELVSLITTQQEEKIRRGELDVGLMRHPVYSPEIDYLELFDEPLVVVLPVDHPLAHEKEITAAQLDGVNFVSTDPAYSGSLAPIVKAWFAQENSQPNIVQVATNILVTMNLVGMGLGVTLIPGYMNNFNTGQVVFRPIAGNVPSIALLMAWKKGEMKPALRDFIAIVQERLASVTA